MLEEVWYRPSPKQYAAGVLSEQAADTELCQMCLRDFLKGVGKEERGTNKFQFGGFEVEILGRIAASDLSASNGVEIMPVAAQDPELLVLRNLKGFELQFYFQSLLQTYLYRVVSELCLKLLRSPSHNFLIFVY